MLFFLLFSLSLQDLSAQYVLKGKVLTEKNSEPVAAASVYAIGNQQGVIADLDGRFELNLKKLPDTLEVRCLGFLPKRIRIESANENLQVSLEESETNFDEVVILPGINPAHRLIQAAIDNADQHNPAKKKEYKFSSYNKLKVAFDKSGIDLSKPPKNPSDSLSRTTDLFLWETVTQRIYRRPGQLKERVTASRISGLKGLALPFSTTDLQGLSVYDPTLTVLNVEFVGPLHPNATNIFLFQLKDTLFDGKDTVFTIHFFPKSKFTNGLSGELTVHTAGYAVPSLRATAPMPSDFGAATEVNIRQINHRLNDSTWFPKQLLMDFSFKITQQDTTVPNFIFTGRSDIDSVDLNPGLRGRDFDQYAIEVEDTASEVSEKQWDKLRTDSLSKVEKRTYELIDSIGETVNLIRIMRQLDKLRTGYIAIGPVDLNINRLFNINPVEGARIGLGLRTNERISRYFSLEGWGGYGFKDNLWKYGGSFDVKPFKKPSPSLQIGYESELTALGDEYVGYYASRPIYERPRVLRALRNYFYEPMTYRQTSWAAINVNPFKYAQLRLEVRNRIWQQAPVDFQSFNVNSNEAMVQLRYAWREKWVKSSLGEWTIGAPYPILDIRWTGGQTNQSQEYQQIDASITQAFHLRRLGRFRVQVNAGQVLGDVVLPVLHFFSASGDPSWVSDPMTFQTMKIRRMQPYVAQKYATCYLEWGLNNTRFPSIDYSPDPLFRINIGWGESDFSSAVPTEGNVMRLQSPDRGYYEAGIGFTGIMPKDVLDIAPSLRFFGVGFYVGRDARHLNAKSWMLALKLEYAFLF